MEKPIHKDLARIKMVAVLQAIEHNCNYNIVIFNPVYGRFDEDRSTYEIVQDSYFETERPHVLKIYDTTDMMEHLSDHFDEHMVKLLEDKRQAMQNLRNGIGKYASYENTFTQPVSMAIINPYPPEKAEKSPVKVTQVIKTSPDIGRNDPCPCGSGKKYKRCCLKE